MRGNGVKDTLDQLGDTLVRSFQGRVLDELARDQNWLLTVHGRMDTEVSLDAAYVETSSLARKLDSGRLRPQRACELSAAVVGSLINRLREFLTDLTHESWRLERQVTAGHVGDPEPFLEELFGVSIEAEDVETVGGLLAYALGRVPIAGSVATVAGLTLTAESLEGRRNRIATVTVERNRPGQSQNGR